MNKLFALCLVILLFSACKKTTTIEELPTPLQTVEGFVALYNEFGQALPNSAGATVSLDSTSFSAITDSAGKFVIKNVPAGSYTVSYTKNGYGTIKQNYHDYQGGGNYLLLSVNLYANSTSTITGLSATYSNDASGKFINLSL